LLTKLRPSSDEYSIWDRVYFRVCCALQQRLGIDPDGINVSSKLEELIPRVERESVWRHIRSDVDAAFWPKIGKATWWIWNTFDSPCCTTVGEVVHFLVARCPTVAKARNEGWTRNQIVEVVRALMSEALGIPEKDFSEKKSFVRDYRLE
jgi:hypothetical protein